ncbi:MAG: phosphoglycolate phosphatase [Solirubrobacteraceae bacterium]|nr:phosphoglycolate phosphatase [Solirubrobacteraceae bacterium]
MSAAGPDGGALLLLFDIDGTLLQKASLEHARAIVDAASAVHGVDGLERHEVEAAGRTDMAIARSLLLAAGVDAEAIDARADEVAERAIAAYAELCPPDLSARVAPGIPELLQRLAAEAGRYRLSLVTGNLEAVARIKLERAGIGHWFEPGQGGFGSDHRARAQLPPIARGRASDPPWPRERTVVIGDTPRDIACARADGVRVAAVATGPFAVEALADADAVVDDARALLPVLRDWAAAV